MRGVIQLIVLCVSAYGVSSQDIYRGRMRGSMFGEGAGGFGALGASTGFFTRGSAQIGPTGGMAAGFFPQTGTRFLSTGGGVGFLPRTSSFRSPSGGIGLFSQSGSRLGPAADFGEFGSQNELPSISQPGSIASSRTVSSPLIGSILDRTGIRSRAGILSPQGRTRGAPTRIGGPDPEDIRRILGSSILGRELRMGEQGLPRHGGAGSGEEHADGMMRGWDGNPQTLGNRFANEWTSPSQSQSVLRTPTRARGSWGSMPGMRQFG